MSRELEVRWEGVLPGDPQQVWDAFTVHAFGRDAWGGPVGVALHLFAQDADAAGAERAWSAWLGADRATEAVA